MSVENDESSKYDDDDELSSGEQAPQKKEFPKIDFGPPSALSGNLNDLLNKQLGEYSDLQSRLREAEEIVKRRKQEQETRKRQVEEELAICTPEHTLKALHQVVQNPEIIKYLENIGDLVVFELDRGMGKNVILFSRIDLTKYIVKIDELRSQKPYIENSRRTSRDKKKSLSRIEMDIMNTTNEMDYISRWGGNIFLYAERDNQYHHLDYYCRDGDKANRSLTLLQVFFGGNREFEDSFHLFNTPSRVMESIVENLKKYGNREFEKLERRIKEVEEGG